MGQPKVKKQNAKSKYTELAYAQWGQNFSGKLKEFKTWAQVKGPKTLQPALSYALDWLSPELLGTGFRMFEVSDLEMKAYIPANKTNLDSQFEIHQGLIANATFELARSFIQRQVPDQFFQITGSEFSLVKKSKWDTDLNLSMKISHAQLDDFFVNVQKNKKAVIEFDFSILSVKSDRQSKGDLAQMKIHIATIELIS